MAANCAPVSGGKGKGKGKPPAANMREEEKTRKGKLPLKKRPGK